MPSKTARNGPAEKSWSAPVRRQKFFGLLMSSDSATPDRIVKFGVMTSAPFGDAEGQCGNDAGLSASDRNLQDHRLVRGFEVSTHRSVGTLLRLADFGIRFNVRGEGLKHMVRLVGGLFGAPILEPEGLMRAGS